MTALVDIIDSIYPSNSAIGVVLSDTIRVTFNR